MGKMNQAKSTDSTEHTAKSADLTVHTEGSFRSRDSKKTKVRKSPRDDRPKYVPKNSINADIVERYYEYFNNHDLEGYVSLTTQDCDMRFSGDVVITVKDYGEMVNNTLESFPDFTCKGEKPVEVAQDVVVVKNAVCSGTHTGTPYGFGTFPPLQSNGVRCANDPEQQTFFMKDGKIAKIIVIADGKLCGPVGFYQQIKAGASK